MLGTKMRALFQRRRGRDLFDLYRALTMRGRVGALIALGAGFNPILTT
jgi:predicted nucleotidyltransferase component of viral defense system